MEIWQLVKFPRENQMIDVNDIPEIHTFNSDGKLYVYSASTNTLFNINNKLKAELYYLKNKGLAEFIKNYPDSNLKFLISKEHLMAPKHINICHPSVDFVDELLSNRLSQLVLQVTKSCNFKCRYCGYAGNGDYQRTHSEQYMSFSVAKKAIDYLYKHSSDSSAVNICMYGGEPLLNYELIKYIINYSKEIFFNTNLEFNITTNASILNKEIVSFFEQNSVKLLISLDGPAKIQNRHRCFLKNGNDTFDVVINNVNNLRVQSPSYFDSHVKFNPVILSKDELFAVEDFFFKELNIPTERVNIRTADLSGVDYYDDYELTVNSTQDESTNRLNKIIYDDYNEVMRTANRSKEYWHHNGPCVPGVDRLFVSCEGVFYPCEKISEISCVAIGDVDAGIDNEKVKQLLNIGKLTEEECQKCWAKHFCNICLLKCVDFKGNYVSAEVKRRECNRTRKNVDKFLKLYVKEKALLTDSKLETL